MDEDTSIRRRLSAILAADIAGYSRLMGQDEAATVRDLKGPQAVIHDETRIYGGGINVAARLEGLAEPGGVLVSQAVHDQVRDRLDLAFEDLGERELKNIARPVGVSRFRW